MKKFVLALALLGALTAPLAANAYTYYNVSFGVYVGNTCRSGPYFQIVTPQVVGTGCYLPAFNLFGVITSE